MKPANLVECISALEEMLPLEDQAWFLKGNDPVTLHHSLGRWMRNNWGLWDENSELHKFFKTLGLWHADDMSGVILTSFARHLKNEPLDIETQVQHYLDYWKKNEQTNS